MLPIDSAEAEQERKDRIAYSQAKKESLRKRQPVEPFVAMTRKELQAEVAEAEKPKG